MSLFYLYWKKKQVPDFSIKKFESTLMSATIPKISQLKKNQTGSFRPLSLLLHICMHLHWQSMGYIFRWIIKEKNL